MKRCGLFAAVLSAETIEKERPRDGGLISRRQCRYHQLLFLRRGARYLRALGRYVRRTRFGRLRRRPPPPLIPTPNENDTRILGSSFLCRYKWSKDNLARS
jgi:hypothetical protein